jgi:hypothetical protein
VACGGVPTLDCAELSVSDSFVIGAMAYLLAVANFVQAVPGGNSTPLILYEVGCAP